jgi:outer membrane protein OmpU
MKKILLGSTALVAAGMIASAPASAKMKLSVGGYMEQWIGYVSQDDVTGPNGIEDYSGVDVKSDSEVHFKGMVKLDNGMHVGVNMQLEGNGGGDTIDESYLILKGGFGEINLGSENSALYKMHYSAKDYGIGFNSGDQSAWVETGGSTSISQSGHYRQPIGSTNIEPNGMNDSEKITYYTPRVNGFQLGVSYAPWAGEDSDRAFDRNSNQSDYVTAGANYKAKMGAMSVGISAGYGTVTDPAQEGQGSTNEPEAMAFGVRLGMGAFGVNAAMANFEDTGSADGTAFAASVTYDSGPMGISLGYHHGEREGDAAKAGQAEADVFHLSAKYSLGSGVTWASTLGMATYSTDDPAIADDEHSQKDKWETKCMVGNHHIYL